MEPNENKVLIWDAVVRLGHWLMALGFLVAWLTGESERLRLVHVAAGGTVAAVVLFRVVWGFVGPWPARFSSFVRPWREAWDYLVGLARLQPRHYTGHNPAGGIAILALLALGILTPLFGWFAYEEIGGKFAEKAHEALANFMLAVVLVHLTGVFVGSLAHRENLVRAMVLGVKRAAPQEAIERPYTPMAVVLFVWVAIVVYWLLRQ